VRRHQVLLHLQQSVGDAAIVGVAGSMLRGIFGDRS